MYMVGKVVMKCQKHLIGLDCNKGMDMIVKVTMECQKHKVGLDCNKDMGMVGNVAMKCQEHQLGRHENCLEHGQHAGGTLLKHLRNQIVAVNGKIL